MSISHNIPKVIKDVQRIQKQANFATRKTINQCLERAQKHTTGTLLPDRFTVRSQWFQPGRRYGMNAQFANRERLEGRMGSRAEWLRIQEHGGTKTPRNQFLSIPVEARPSPTSVVPRRLRAKALKNRKNVFTIATKDGGRMMLMREKGRTRVMHVFRPEAQVKPVMRFEPENKQMVEKLFPQLFALNFAAAIATAK